MKNRFAFHRSGLLALSLALILTTVVFAASGALDTTFSSDGRVILNFGGTGNYGTALAVQPDGKLVVVGMKNIDGGSNIAISRFTPGGDLDTTFSGDGKQLINVAAFDTPRAVAIQTDGKIVIGGESCNALMNPCNMTVVRLKPNGSLDPTFSGDGKVTTPYGTGHNFVRDMVMQGGKIILAGANHDGSSTNGLILRYTSTGAIDPTFSGDGIMIIPFGGNDVLTSVAVYDSKIYVAGYSTSATYTESDFIAARIKGGGILDPTFSGDGKVKTDLGSYDSSYGMVISGGKMILVGTSLDKLAVVRYTSTGALDPTFSGDGKVMTDLGFANVNAEAVTLQSGKIVISGGASPANGLVVRFTSAGVLDTTFSTDGFVTTDWGGGLDGYTAVQFKNSRIYVTGNSISTGGFSRFIVAAYKP